MLPGLGQAPPKGDDFPSHSNTLSGEKGRNTHRIAYKVDPFGNDPQKLTNAITTVAKISHSQKCAAKATTALSSWWVPHDKA